MPRSPRLIEPGGIYHVAPRGNDRRAIYVDQIDRVHHLALLEKIVRERNWLVFGYCLMTNHFHLLVQVPEGDLSAGMQLLLGGYSRRWNQRYERTGHLFQNRFTSTPVLSDRHLIAAVRYIESNPVRAGIARRPQDWEWSSYRAHRGLAHPPPFLATTAFTELLGPTPNAARRAYRSFVQEGLVPVSDTVAKL